MPDLFVNQNEVPETQDLQAENITTGGSDTHKVNALSCFSVNPSGVTFQHQDPDEKILLFLRKHLITNLPWVVITLLLLFIPIIISVSAPFFNFDLSFIPSGFITISILFYYSALFSYALINFMTWSYNIFIVTHKRVIDVDYSNTVVHNVAETKMSHIQDVNYNQVGFISSLFNFGDVFVQTAGNEVNFEAIAVPQPRHATKIIAELIGKPN